MTYTFTNQQVWKPTCEGKRLHSRWLSDRQPNQRNRFQRRLQLQHRQNVIKISIYSPISVGYTASNAAASVILKATPM